VVTYGAGLRLEFSVTGLINVGGVLAAVLPAFDRGILSINEVRQMMGMPPNPNPIFNDHYFLGGYMPVDLAGLVPDQTLMEQAGEGITEEEG